MKVLVIFGTRPEAIKMCPLVIELKKYNNIISKTVVTAQHREMLDQVLDIFKVTPDYDLNIMKDKQTIKDITVNVLNGITEILKTEKPDLIFVHGDTTTAFAASLAGFYENVKVAHVEAGLRSFNLKFPFPEEANRKLIDSICDFHFAPTDLNVENLINENVNKNGIFKTGNTVIDALKYVSNLEYDFSEKSLENIDYSKKVILVTCHRRENLGSPMRDIFSAINKIVEDNEDSIVIFPIHKNPKVREIQREVLVENERVHIIEPLDYLDFVKLMKKSYLILTDSGGIQEEAPYFGVPVLVLRTVTEREEAIDAGTVKLVGIEYENIVNEANELMKNKNSYEKMANAKNPYGDGTACEKIVKYVIQNVEKN